MANQGKVRQRQGKGTANKSEANARQQTSRHVVLRECKGKARKYLGEAKARQDKAHQGKERQ